MESILLVGAAVRRMQTNDYWFFFRRIDAGPLITLVNAFVGYTFTTLDLGPYRKLSALLSIVTSIAFYIVYEFLSELSLVLSGSMGQPSLALRRDWGGTEPLLGNGAARLIGILIGCLYVWAIRAPPLFRLDDAHSTRHRASNYKYLIQRLVISYAAIYLGPNTDSPSDHLFRYELMAYFGLKTLALLIVYVWNRSDDEERVRLYGAKVRDYDVRWAAFFSVYLLLLAGGAYAYAPVSIYGAVASAAALGMTLAFRRIQRHARTAYSGFAMK
jgi:hypothetical protein